MNGLERRFRSFVNVGVAAVGLIGTGCGLVPNESQVYAQELARCKQIAPLQEGGIYWNITIGTDGTDTPNPAPGWMLDDPSSRRLERTQVGSRIVLGGSCYRLLNEYLTYNGQKFAQVTKPIDMTHS